MTRVPNTKEAGGDISAGAWGFCAYCGERMAFSAPSCPACGKQAIGASAGCGAEKSPKSYGVAVALCGIFGMMGLHHFYIGQWVHGLIDLAMFFAWIALWMMFGITGQAGYGIWAAIVFCLDALHTVYVFYVLIIGQQKDGRGRLVTFEAG